ncbi:MAG: hypothetical protein LBP21_00680 [Synergistaceae bacterium]|jgi:hypothetical protein|nr:hypothetical protein [Synergistaceae bacterium]
MTTTAQPREPEMGDLRMEEEIDRDDRKRNWLDEFEEFEAYDVSRDIIQKFAAIGLRFFDLSLGRQIFVGEGSEQKIAEFDLVLENRDAILGVEVEVKPSKEHVRSLVRRLEIFRLNKDKRGDKRKIYGAIAGATISRSVKAYALKTGFYVIVQTEDKDTIKIDIPKDFVPKSW